MADLEDQVLLERDVLDVTKTEDVTLVKNLNLWGKKLKDVSELGLPSAAIAVLVLSSIIIIFFKISILERMKLAEVVGLSYVANACCRFPSELAAVAITQLIVFSE